MNNTHETILIEQIKITRKEDVHKLYGKLKNEKFDFKCFAIGLLCDKFDRKDFHYCFQLACGINCLKVAKDIYSNIKDDIDHNNLCEHLDNENKEQDDSMYSRICACNCEHVALKCLLRRSLIDGNFKMSKWLYSLYNRHVDYIILQKTYVDFMLLSCLSDSVEIAKWILSIVPTFNYEEKYNYVQYKLCNIFSLSINQKRYSFCKWIIEDIIHIRKKWLQTDYIHKCLELIFDKDQPDNKLISDILS